MFLRTTLAVLGAAVLHAAAHASDLAAAPPAAPPAVPERIDADAWDARAAEHLLNRAGFGAGSLEVERLVASGPEAAVASLFAPQRFVDPYFLALDETLR